MILQPPPPTHRLMYILKQLLPNKGFPLGISRRGRKPMSTIQGKDNSNNRNNFLRTYSMPSHTSESSISFNLSGKGRTDIKNEIGEGKKQRSPSRKLNFNKVTSYSSPFSFYLSIVYPSLSVTQEATKKVIT